MSATGHHTAIKKIYIDTRFRTDNSQSTSDFKISLPESVNLPENTKFFIDDISIPHSWYSIEEGLNDKFYVRMIFVETKAEEDVVFTIPSKNYTGATLAFELKSKLNARHTDGDDFDAGYDEELNIIQITMTSRFHLKVLNKYDLKTKIDGSWAGPEYDANNPTSLNLEILKLSENTEKAEASNITHPFNSGPIDLQPIKNIYLSSPNMGSYTTIGPRGERTILKKIPVTAGFNFVIFDNTIIKEEFLDISKQTLSTIHILIHDSYGNLIPLHNSEWSCSLCFSYSG